MPNFDPKPEGMPYALWLREKNLAIKVKMAIHKDSGLPQEYIDHAKIPEIYERNLGRQGKKIEPEDM